MKYLSFIFSDICATQVFDLQADVVSITIKQYNLILRYLSRLDHLANSKQNFFNGFIIL